MLLLSSLAKAATAAHWLAAVEEGEPSAARTPTSASLRSAATAGFAKEERGELNTHRDGVGGGGGRLGQIRGVVSVVGGRPGREGRRVGRLEAVVVPQRSKAKVGLASALGSPPLLPWLPWRGRQALGEDANHRRCKPRTTLILNRGDARLPLLYCRESARRRRCRDGSPPRKSGAALGSPSSSAAVS